MIPSHTGMSHPFLCGDGQKRTPSGFPERLNLPENRDGVNLLYCKKTLPELMPWVWAFAIKNASLTSPDPICLLLGPGSEAGTTKVFNDAKL